MLARSNGGMGDVDDNRGGGIQRGGQGGHLTGDWYSSEWGYMFEQGYPEVYLEEYPIIDRVKEG
eukprot:764057-Hanusia_phi.AAC.1